MHLYRDEAQQKMIALQEKAEKDRQQHNAEMKELIRFLDHDRRLRVFMNTKGRDRPEDQQMMTWREKESTYVGLFVNRLVLNTIVIAFVEDFIP